MADLPTLQQLRYLVSLAETLSFTRAAQACNVGQSTLSAGVRELEGTLGVRLFTRSRRQVALTPQGQAALRRAQDLLAGAGDLVALAQLAAQPMRGQLRLGIIPTIAPFQLPRILPALDRRYPQLQISIREDLTDSLIERLNSRRLDMALIALPHGTKGLLARPLFDEELRLVGRRGDPFLRPPVRLNAKLAERLLLLEQGHCLREHSLQACKRRHAGPEGLEASSLLTLVQMAEHGLGLALLPQMALEAGLLRGTRLSSHAVAKPAPKRSIALVTRAATPQREAFDKVAAVIRECQSWMSSTGTERPTSARPQERSAEH